MPPDGTPVGSLGEFGLIDRLRAILGSPDDAGLRRRLVKGISDDAAVLLPVPDRLQLISTDSYAEGIHFDLTYTSPHHLGWKVMAASLSDIAAMAGRPDFATVALCIPQKATVELISRLYEGVAAACREYSVAVVGGDTTASSGGLIIGVTVTGSAGKDRVVYRSGAQPGDLLCVSGHLGASHAGLKILLREKARFAGSDPGTPFIPDLARYTSALEKHFMPRPRFDIAGFFSERIRVHAMIDISDGLASEIHHICSESGVGAALYERSIPVDLVTQHIAGEFSESPLLYALYGGDEYELLFTISDTEYEKLENLTEDVSVIGRMTEADKGIVYVRENGETEPLAGRGWDHFRAPGPGPDR
ncbi:MAG TPA: thiamine-phosphate kinase [Bacteroidota bacterium]|nr:thiamine-phosphate kinase [Bacteroidota bacterium]